VSTQPHVTDDDEGGDNPCSEDEEFFQGRPGAEDMKEAITKFLDGLEGQERSGFKDLHRFLGRLPCPDVEKVGRSMSHSEAVEGGFILTMNEEEQKRFTPLELLLYRHALEYCYLFVHGTYSCMNINAVVCTQYILRTYTLYIVQISTYTVHTQAFLYIHCTYIVQSRDNEFAVIV
jgi:hypothetical protein